MTRNDDETDHGEPDRAISRRTAMAGAGGSLVATVGLAGCLGSTDTNDEGNGDEKGTGKGKDTDTDDRDEAKHRHDVLDVAFSADIDMDMRFTNRMQLDGDPTGGDRQQAVHLTSLGDESGDYSCMAVDLQDHDYELGALSDPGSISYDFYGGKNAAYAIPDEVFLILKLSGKRYAVAYRKKDVGKTGQWETRDVSSELTQDEWRAVDIDPKHVDAEGRKVHVTTEVVQSRIEDLRHAETFADLLGHYGDDAKLVGLAVGAGRLTGETITDHYFDNIQVGEKSFTVPAMLSMDVDFTPPRVQPGEGNFTTTLSFANPSGDEHGVSLEDIDADSVRMAPYSSLAPPLPGTDESDRAVSANRLRNVTGRGADVEFDASAVSELLDDGSETTVLIYGAFEGEEPYTFLAVDELERAG